MIKINKRILVGGGFILLLGFVFLGALLWVGGKSFPETRMNVGSEQGKLYPQEMMLEEPSLSVDSFSEDIVFDDSMMNPIAPILEGDTVSIDQQIIREANLSIRVEDTNSAVEKIRGVAEWHKGSLFSVDIREDGQGVRSGFVVIKVPTGNFDAAIAGIKEGATVVVQESVSNQDVTAEFIDMEARLKNKKAEEEAFIKILDKAEKTTDIISVTRELSRVRGEIEVMEGQLRYMESKTQLATITVQLSEDQNVTFVETWRPWQEVKDSASKFLGSLQKFVSFVIVMIVWFLPLLVLYGVLALCLWLVIRFVYRKSRKIAVKK